MPALLFRALPTRRLVTTQDVLHVLPYNLGLCRRQADLTLHQLGLRLGVSPSTLGSYEEGRAQPPLRRLAELATFYRVTPSQLLGADSDGQ